MPPWLAHAAAVWLPLSVLAALYVAADVALPRHRPPMRVMAFVWPLTVLYWGPVGLIFYFWFGRANRAPSHETHETHETHDAHAEHRGQHEAASPPSGPSRPMWQAVFEGAAHCGAGCALGDFIGDWLAYGTDFRPWGSVFAGKVVVGFVLAYVLGIVFQFFAIAPMRGLGVREGLVQAIKADTLSLVAYEVGMFVVMWVTSHAFAGLTPKTLAYWLPMQWAMLAGFATTYPVNVWLIARGIKERM